METKLNLDVINGLSFEQILGAFVPKPLEMGEHSVFFKAFPFIRDEKTKQIIGLKTNFNEATKRQTVTATVHVDDEAHDRQQVFSALDIQYMTQNICRQAPELAGQSTLGILESLVNSGLVVKFWVVENTNPAGQTFKNWLFYKPAEIVEATTTTGAGSTFA